jgi:hypothetical protein
MVNPFHCESQAGRAAVFRAFGRFRGAARPVLMQVLSRRRARTTAFGDVARDDSDFARDDISFDFR